MPKKYTDKQKIAYWKAQAKGAKKFIKGQGAYHHPGRPQYVKGSGAYKIPKGMFAKMGAAAGRKLAPGIYSPLGGAVGGLMGHGLAQISGIGDYSVKGNTVIYPQRMVPSFGMDSIRVRKREMISIINSTTGFTNQTFPIQPGFDDSFPWPLINFLAPLAWAFQ